MSLPSISIINFSSQLSDQAVQDAIRVVNRQVVEDFMPVWGGGRNLRLHASPFDPTDESTLTEDPVQGESVIYLVDEGSLPGALGFHSLNGSEIPFGFVFTDSLADWTVTLSHEVLELIIDPTANVFVPGPDPRDPNNDQKVVLHTYEVCDAVERTSYEIDHTRVSNFLTPTYFAVGDAPGTRNDFLGVGVTSFGATQGSHLAFFDLSANEFIPDFIGERAPRMDVLSKRAMAFDREKPERLPEPTLGRVLRDCKEKYETLRPVRGITRTGRYLEAGRRMGLSKR